MDPSTIEKYFQSKIKVNGGKAGALGDSIRVSRDKARVTVSASVPFSKRYLKYLTRRALKKYNFRDWLRIVASNKTTYELRYFNIAEDEEEEEAGEE